MANMKSLTACRARELTKHLPRVLKQKLVPMIRSSPGLGKSDIVRGIARQYNLKLLDMRLAQMDPTDLNGLPHFNEEGFAVYAPFVYFPLETAKPGINPETQQPYNGWLIFFDEITSANKQIQAAAYKIILDRMIGQHRLNDAVAMVAAGNLETDNAVVHTMSTALQSRLIHFDLKVDLEDWTNWAVKADVDSRVIAFLQFKPDLLYQFKPDSQEHTFPCPRTWEFASKLVKDVDELSAADLPVVAGAISPGPAQEFIEFTKIYQTLPKIDAIIANPSTVVIPNEPGIRFALSTMIAQHITDTTTPPLMEFLTRLPVECRVICMRLIAARSPSVFTQPAAVKMFGSLGRAMSN